MPQQGRKQDGPSSVVLATRVAPDEKRLAQLAADAAGDVSLSAFARRAIRDRAIRVAAERGIAQEEIKPTVEEERDVRTR